MAKITAIIHVHCSKCGAEYQQRTEQIDESLDSHQYITDGKCRNCKTNAAGKAQAVEQSSSA